MMLFQKLLWLNVHDDNEKETQSGNWQNVHARNERNQENVCNLHNLDSFLL